MEMVVLVHGLFLRGALMLPLTLRLRAAGFATCSFSYPTRRLSPGDNARALKRFVEGIDAPVVHFLAHSLGGLVLRHFFAGPDFDTPGRVVTLGTPHRCSHAARVLAGFELGRRMLDRSLECGLLGDSPPWDGRRELGSIAGTLPVGLGRAIPGLPLPNDGTVAVEETRVEGMSDHVCLPVSHTGMMFAPSVAEQSAHFLRHGRFKRLNP
ncbi:MAG: esterase/lipase family protein [Chromatiales bacterium]